MPTINISLKDLSNLVGKKINEKELRSLLEYAKAELDSIEGDEVSVQFNDTNLPYLWCAEGLAILFRGILGREKGVPELKIEKSDYKIIVDKSIRPVRPFISAFVARGGKIDNFLLKQMIQLQEKFCDNFGRKREKVAIGIYPSKKISFPVYYTAVPPKSVRFVPLEFSKEMTLAEILEEHPKGKEFSWILKDTKKYPLLYDANRDVLSFPPIINSNTTGKLEIRDTELFFEATGTDLDAVNLAASVFAHALAMRGFRIYGAKVSYVGRNVFTPDVSISYYKLNKDEISKLLGLELKESDVKKLLEMARFNFKNYSVGIPSFRNDIMHCVDIIEDIAVMYGFENIASLPLTTYSVGSTFGLQDMIDKYRDVVVGLGYQEILSPILTSKEILVDRMNLKKVLDIIEVSNAVSINFSVLRSWLLPGLMNLLMHNKHIDFPQMVFEQGLISIRDNEIINDEEHIAGVSSHINASFTEAKQAVDVLMRACGAEAAYDDMEHNSFIPGRVAQVIVKDKPVGFVGEIHPFVLNAWGLDMPAAGFELNLSDLLIIIKK